MKGGPSQRGGGQNAERQSEEGEERTLRVRGVGDDAPGCVADTVFFSFAFASGYSGKASMVQARVMVGKESKGWQGESSSVWRSSEGWPRA